MDELDYKVKEIFKGKIVRKDVTNQLSKTVSARAFVIEYLVGMYCSSENEQEIQKGIEQVKKILSMNFAQANGTEKIKHNIVESREKGYVIIDKISVAFNEKENRYFVKFTNLKIDKLEIHGYFVKKYLKLLDEGGVWGKIKLRYRQNEASFEFVDFEPIQIANFNIEDMFRYRQCFDFDEWQSLLIRTIGYEPSGLDEKAKMEILIRCIPLIEKNYNLCELGPRGTGKSYTYNELSPYSILISGGKTTVANLFLNLNSKRTGLVCNWDCVAFDECAGMDFKDKDMIQILKGYMDSGSFTRGKDSTNGEASIVLVGNIDNGSDYGLYGRKLFEPFPTSFNNDSAFFDRIHYYIPGWDIPKISSNICTSGFGIISDYFAEFCKEMRRYDYSDKFKKYFEFNSSCNIRDEKAIQKTFSGLAKLLYPGMEMTKEQCCYLLNYATEGRKRVKRQLAEMATEYADYDVGVYEILWANTEKK